MTDLTPCEHPTFSASVVVNRFEDRPDLFVADVTAVCAVCERSLVFVGADRGVSFSRPMMSVTGKEIHLPCRVEAAGE